jgi:beta-xylosidase
MPHRDDIQIRDPYILVSEGEYWMYGTTDPDPWNPPAQGFDAFRSRDLVSFDKAHPVFRPPADFWADRNFWAPEVHLYAGSYFMFASFKAEARRRGTQILRSPSPAGPFSIHSPDPVTPTEWECLDGTLWVEDGRPWIVFCHEWVQIGVGTVCALPLRDDLTAGEGEPSELFRADEAAWARPHNDRGDFITDGPFLYRTRGGELLMLWSSAGDSGYAVGIARSESKSLAGPWKQEDEPLYGRDGGHAMIFRDLSGELILSLHSPNNTPNERPLFVPLEERDESLYVKNH